MRLYSYFSPAGLLLRNGTDTEHQVLWRHDAVLSNHREPEGFPRTMSAVRAQVLADLRDRISSIEGVGVKKAGCLPFGVADIDAILPSGGLANGALHEFAGGGSGTVDGAAAALFAAGIAARTKAPIVWCLTRPDLFFPALAQVGLHPKRVIFVEGDREEELPPTWKRRSPMAGWVLSSGSWSGCLWSSAGVCSLWPNEAGPLLWRSGDGGDRRRQTTLGSRRHPPRDGG